ncbi:hypothetical protein D3C81_699440 [compost metagenome]
MIAALGLDQLAGVRVFIDLYDPRAALFRRADRAFVGRFWIEDGDNIAQALVVVFHQVDKFLFELDFALQAGILFKRLQLRHLFLKGLFGSAELCKSGHCHHSFKSAVARHA